MDTESVICTACGTTLTARSEDELVQRVRDHEREAHNIEVTEDEAREYIRKTRAQSD